MPRVPAGTSLVNKQVPKDERPRFDARRADVLGVLAESFIKNGGERHQIVVHVDAETLRDGMAGQCEVEDGPSVPAETVRRLAFDCSAALLCPRQT